MVFVKSLLYPIVAFIWARIALVEGTLKGGKTPFRCMLVGQSSFNDDFKVRIYEGPPSEIRSWRVPILLLPYILSRQQYDLCVAVLPTFYDLLFRRLCKYKGQEEVRQVIDTSASWEEVRKSFSKKKRQVTNNFAEKHGLSYRMTNDEKDFDHFYYRMHVPHIQRRYGQLAQVDSYSTMKGYFEKGLLLFVIREDIPVAGALSLIEGKTLVFRRSGVLDGDEANVKGGAQTALYYFQIKYAVDNKFDAVDTMKSAPFLNDGVFRHKAEWGAMTLPDHEATRTIYFFTRADAGTLAQLFAAHPLIVHKESGLMALLGDSVAPDLASTQSGRVFAQQFHMPGLSKAVVHTRGGASEIALRNSADFATEIDSAASAVSA